jgi:hypothetical protein
MGKGITATLLVALVAAAAAGCGSTGGTGGTGDNGKEAKWEGEAKAYAVYATQIPLYPGAKIEDVMGSDTYGDTPDSHNEGMAWWYEVTATQAELDTWYAARLTGATKTNEDGTIVYTLAPQGGESGEEMGVHLEDNKLRVFERTKAGKHKG